MKQITIVIPTRNRSQLLIPLLKHIKKYYDDKFYDIIICDNSSSLQNKKKINLYLIKNFKNLKVFYKKKHMEKEQFFQWSALKVKTSHFFFLFDDDIINRKSFDILKKYFDILKNNNFFTFNRSLSYYDKNYPDVNKSKILDVPSFTGQLYSINSSTHLKEIYFNLEIGNQSPMVTNTVFRSSFFKKLVKKYKKIFTHGHMGDYNCAVKNLANSNKFIFLDFPIVLFGQSTINTTSQLRDAVVKSDEYINWIKYYMKNKLNKMPLKSYFFLNCIASVLIEMSNELKLNAKINFDKYFFLANKEFERLLNLDVPRFVRNPIIIEKKKFKINFNKKNIFEKNHVQKLMKLKIDNYLCKRKIQLNFNNIKDSENFFFMLFCKNKNLKYKIIDFYFFTISDVISPFSKVIKRLHNIFKNF